MRCEMCYREIVVGLITVHAPQGKHHYHTDCLVKLFHGENHEKTDTKVSEQTPPDQV